MANQLLTRQEITNYGLMVLKNNLVVIPNMYRDLDKEFGNEGGKIGDTIYMRKPQRYIGRDGQAYQPEGMTDTQVPVTIDQQSGVDMEMSSAELYLSIDDFGERTLGPAAESVANKLDSRAALTIVKNTSNVVCTPGTTPGLGGTDAFLTYAQAGKVIDQAGFPLLANKSRAMIIDPDMKVGWQDFSKSYYNPQKFVDGVWNGQIADTLGYKWFEDQNVPAQVIGALGGTPAVVGAGQTGSTINITGCTPNVIGYLNVGDNISFQGEFDVNPQSRAAYKQLKQHVIQAQVNTDGSGNATLTISPSIVPTGQFQNVSNSPANGALMNVYGVNAAGQAQLSGLSTTQGFLFEKQAFAFVSFPGPVPTQAEMAYQKRSKSTGVSMRFVRMFDPRTDQWINRYDVYYGMAPLYTEGACRIAA